MKDAGAVDHLAKDDEADAVIAAIRNEAAASKQQSA